MRYDKIIEIINEANSAKLRVEKFKLSSMKNIGKKTIILRLMNFVKSNPEYSDEIHLPAPTGKAAAYNKDSMTVIAVTDKSILAHIKRSMNIFDIASQKGDDEYVVSSTNGSKVKFRLSSGRGFYFDGEKEQSSPTTAQQETGTIKFLEHFIYNGRYPSKKEVSEIVGFNFDDKWYSSFVNQADAITKFIHLKSSMRIDLDSSSSSIGKKAYSLLKRNHGFKESDDNWNPADIWIVDTGKESKILAELDAAPSVLDFNVKMKEFFDDKTLIGVSLKKMLHSAQAKVIDISKAKPFDLSFKESIYNVSNTYWDIETSGYPERFMIRARAKAKTITKKSDIRIFFEGKLKNSSEFLGAIPTRFIKTSGSDSVSFDIDYDHVVSMANEVEKLGFMKVKNLEALKSSDEMKLTYVYVMLRYAQKIYSAGKNNLQNLGRAGFKLNKFSSVHLKVGG